jgi:hypothetical protein
MLKFVTKLLTVVIFTALFTQYGQAQAVNVREEVKLSLWYDGLSEMVQLHEQLLSEHLGQEAQTAELEAQMQILEQYPEELLLPLMDV